MPASLATTVPLEPEPTWLHPDWPAIPGVCALFSSRTGGVSAAPFDAMNLGSHVGDEPAHVQANRARFAQQFSQLATQPMQPVFLSQTHGCQVALLGAQPSTYAKSAQSPVRAFASDSADCRGFDACLSASVGVGCTILVADCLSVLLAYRGTDGRGWCVGAAHAGWRGLAGVDSHNVLNPSGGVLEHLWRSWCELVRSEHARRAQHAALPSDAQIAAHTQAWLGPCIGPTAFEVGTQVRDAFMAYGAQAAACFEPTQRAGQYRAHLSELARQRLQGLGLAAAHIYGNDGSAPWCTFSNATLYFSHRRDARALGSTGRMAAVIGLTEK